MKLNHMICPHCGHDFYTKSAYATCDACNCFFYASQSKTCNPEKPGFMSTFFGAFIHPSVMEMEESSVDLVDTLVDMETRKGARA